MGERGFYGVIIVVILSRIPACVCIYDRGMMVKTMMMTMMREGNQEATIHLLQKEMDWMMMMLRFKACLMMR